jgi:hypothetical protein
MKRITKITVLALALVLLAGVMPGFRRLAELQPTVQAANRHVFTLDVAVDCRTFVTGPNRGDISFLNGKIFPAGTLPSGAATNDPIQPVNGVTPIGDWLTRGQNAFPFPPEVAEAYSSTPAFFATQYYILNDGRALTVEGYASATLESSFAVTGGIGGFRGASGDIQGGGGLGTNITGCPNFRVTFNFVTVFVPRASND